MPLFDPSTWTAQAPTATIPKCGACGLYKGCVSPKMKPTGTGRRKILLIGDRPSRDDDESGMHFQGVTGFILRPILQSLGVRIQDCLLTHAITCKPKGMENELLPLYLESCVPNLNNTIREFQPNVIIPMGTHAIRQVIGQERKDIGEYTRWLGFAIPSVFHNAWIVPTYDPLFFKVKKDDPVVPLLMRQHINTALALEHVKPDGMPVKDIEGKVEVILNPRQAVLRVGDLAKKAGRLAWDYETNCLKPETQGSKLICVSFCYEGTDTFSTPITSDLLGPLSAVLRNPKLKKIASNKKFEERWTQNKLGHPVASWWWDTMLGAHVLDNRSGVTSVKFQSYVLLGAGDYNDLIEPYLQAAGPSQLSRIEQCSVKDVNTYCGVDSYLEYHVALKQMERAGVF